MQHVSTSWRYEAAALNGNEIPRGKHIKARDHSHSKYAVASGRLGKYLVCQPPDLKLMTMVGSRRVSAHADSRYSFLFVSEE